MNRKYKLVIFDLDGTLLNTKQGIIDSVKYTIEKMGLQPLSVDKVDNFIGPPIQDSFEKEYGIKGESLQEIANIFRDRYKNHDLFKAEIYDGIIDVLKILKREKIKLAVATYKREDYAIQILEKFNLLNYFDIAHGADNENILRKSDIVEMCIKESGIIEKRQVLLVGDTLNDEIGAQKSGVDFLGVQYGFGYKKINKEKGYPIGFVKNPIDIINYIIKN